MSARKKYGCYYFLTLICVVVICSVGMNQVKRTYISRQKEYIQEKVERIILETERVLDSYYRLCERLSKDQRILSLEGKSQLSNEEILQLQQAYEETDTTELGIRQIALYLPQSNVIISNGKLYQDAKMNTFFSQYGGCISGKSLVDGSGAVYQNFKGDDFLLITRKIYGYSGIIGCLILDYSEEVFQKTDTGEMAVYIGNNEDYQYAETACFKEEYQRIIAASWKKEQLRLNGEQCRITTAIYSKLNTAVRVAVPQKILFSGLWMFLVWHWGGVLLSVLAGIPLAFYFYRHILLPAEKLSEAVDPGNTRTDIETVAIQADERINSLEAEVRGRQKEKNYVLPFAMGEKLNLMAETKGGYARQLGRDTMDWMGLDSESSCFVFAIHILQDPKQVFQNDENDMYRISEYAVLNNILSEKIFDKNKGFLCIDRYYFPVLVQADRYEEERLQQKIKEIRKFMKDYFEVVIACSHPRRIETAEQLPEEYRKTREEIAYLAFWKKDAVEETGKICNSAHIPYFKLVRNLVNKLEEKDYEASWKILRQVIDEYAFAGNGEYCSWRIDRYQIYALAGIIITAMYEQVQNAEGESSGWEKVEELYQIDNISEFEEACRKLFREFARIREDSGISEETDNRMAEIRSYIQEHYTENTLNASSVAEHFGKSKSHLSHLFKDAAGENISEYIQKLRTEKAKELLVTCSVKTAAEQSGFWDTQALTRVMKKYEGITPGEFKKQAEQKK